MRRIFIVGFPRSGTTLLQCLLGAHPALVTFPESHLLSEALYRPVLFPWLVLRHTSHLHLVRDFLEVCGHPELLTEPLIAPIKKGDEGLLPDPVLLADNSVRVIDAVAAARGKQGWLEKTPDHLRVWRYFDRVAPDAQFVHIARRPADAISSYHHAAQGWHGAPTRVGDIALRWNRALGRSLACTGLPNHHFVTYESLVQDPHRCAAELARRLGLPEADGFSHGYQEIASAVVLPDENHKSENSKPIEPKSARPLTPSQRWIAARLARSGLYDRFRRNELR